MKTILMALLLLILASCAGGPYHPNVRRDCLMRNLTDTECSNEYYSKRHDQNDFRYKRNTY